MGEWECEICVATFARKQYYDKHVGNGHYEMSTNHRKRLKEVEEAKEIWTKFHLNQGEMPLGPNMKKQKEAQQLPDGIIEVVPLGKVSSRSKGTVPCKNPHCHGAVHPCMSGFMNHKVFEHVAYKIHARGDCATQKFNYVQSCTAHALYRYDGKYCGESERSTYANYVVHKVSEIRVLRELFAAKFHGEKPTEKNLVEFILFLRGINRNSLTTAYKEIYGKESNEEELSGFKKVVPHIKPSDANLHFVREDCHYVNLRVDILAEYKTQDDVDKGEKHLHAVSGCTQWWIGGHNLIDENHRNQLSEHHRPTAFCMMAPMNNLADLTKWMTDHGIDKKHHYGRTDLISTLNSTSSSTTATTSKTEEEILEEQIDFMMRGKPDEYTREEAIVDIEGTLAIQDKYYFCKKRRLQ